VICLRVEYDSEVSIDRKCDVEFLLIMNTSYLIAMHYIWLESFNSFMMK